MDDDAMRRLLTNARTIAVVGCSDNPEKAAHRIPAFLQSRGYRVIPVNPRVEMILGETCYRSLAEIPEPYDLVDIFRPPAQAAEVVNEAIAVKAPAVWLQLGIASATAREAAEKAGIGYVEDRCILVEVERLDVHPL